ncbi:hypothetical protein [Okeania sp. SIO3B5]|uniref:hypothetical protein n=1 Tax=Okeania sp. SIO3B5 TaxID=2607811 RepID=UPI003451CAF2
MYTSYLCLADGYYVTLSLEDKSVPALSCEVEPTLKNTLGIDMGLNEFLVISCPVASERV